MRRLDRLGPAWITAFLAFLIAGAPAFGATKGPKPEVQRFGEGPAYKALAQLAVMHEGRIKPIDTLAREEIKQIYGRETIKFVNDDGDVVASWTPVAALLDWIARPEFWDDQEFITVEYLPLKQFILAEAIKSQLAGIAGRSSADDKVKFEPLLKAATVSANDLKVLLRSTKLAEKESLEVSKLIDRLSESRKWLSPNDLQDAQVTVEGRAVPLPTWLDGITQRKQEAGSMGGAATKLTELERRAFEVGTRLASYRVLRDADKAVRVPLLFLPHPSNTAFLSYSGTAMDKVRAEGRRGLTLLELDTVATLSKYLEQVARKEWSKPGADPTFDANYSNWLRDNSAWIPLAVMVTAPPDELAKAGFSPSKISAFRSAYEAFKQADRTKPGQVDEATANTLLLAVRDIGKDLSPSRYPEPADLNREIAFNSNAPFFYAPWVYATGTILLLLSLAVPDTKESILSSIRGSLYVVGMVGFVSGIGLEVYGFSQRVQITGWAPVTNMYETVIWVGLVTAVLGLGLEAIFRRTYAALAASGVATVCTMLAATIPLLDPKIHGLQPVLRSNLWLTIHVLTIVSSYAAFALAMGLGLIGLSYYLTAVYRRPASYADLGRWMPLSLLTLVGGGVAVYAMDDGYTFGTYTNAAYYAAWGALLAGLVLSINYAVAIAGEVVSRGRLAAMLHTLEIERLLPIAGGSPESEAELGSDLLGDRRISAKEELSIRESAMHETAAKVKTLSNFVYRSMQVGVLLVAAGTILGGVWADYSWGRFWGWDPKEVWALITLLVYLIPLHGRFAGWVNTFGLIFFSVFCFLSVLMAWYGVNFILGVGLHSYGFVEGGSQGAVLVVTSSLLAFATGVWWRRSFCTVPLSETA